MGRGCVLHAFFTITPCSVSTAVNFIDNITVATLANQTSYDRLFEWNRIQNSPENCYAKKFSAFEVNFDALAEVLQNFGESTGTKRSISQMNSRPKKVARARRSERRSNKSMDPINLPHLIGYMHHLCAVVRLKKIAFIMKEFLPLWFW